MTRRPSSAGGDAQRPPAPSPERARELFERWAEEEAAGYRGEVPWEEFKRDLNEGRPAHGKPFPDEG